MAKTNVLENKHITLLMTVLSQKDKQNSFVKMHFRRKFILYNYIFNEKKFVKQTVIFHKDFQVASAIRFLSVNSKICTKRPLKNRQNKALNDRLEP